MLSYASMTVVAIVFATGCTRAKLISVVKRLPHRQGQLTGLEHPEIFVILVRLYAEWLSWQRTAVWAPGTTRLLLLDYPGCEVSVREKRCQLNK